MRVYIVAQHVIHQNLDNLMEVANVFAKQDLLMMEVMNYAQMVVIIVGNILYYILL